MPGYSFQPQFVEPIRRGLLEEPLPGAKGGTIRLARRIPQRWSDYKRTMADAYGNHARLGDTMHLWCKLRTPQAFKIGERECVGAEPIRLVVRHGVPSQVAFPQRQLILFSRGDLDLFAVFDGFEDWDAMCAFWRSTHGELTVFYGWHIRWLPLPEAIDTPASDAVAARIAREELREADFQAGRI